LPSSDRTANDRTTVLAGRIALVTGGGRGIGRATALALAAAGAAVAVAARSASEIAAAAAQIEAAGGRAMAVVMDVTDRAAVEAAHAVIERQLGPIDLLVNNAGSHVAVGPIWEIDPDLWWQDIETSLRGTFLCSRAVLPGMIARRDGRIINFSSGAALEPRPFSSAYATAKAGVLRLTDSMAAATAAHGIAIFAIHPGGVRTDLTERIMASPEGAKAYPNWSTLNWLPPERAANLCVVLASGKADALTGRYIDASAADVDGLLRTAEEIRSDDLYTLRLRT